MSNLTANGVNGLMEAYAAVYDQDLREELEEEEVLVEQVGIDMIENAAYVLFSQGYDVDDVISYFTKASTNTIIEDYLNFSEGNLIIESVVVSDEYIQENFELLENRIKAAVDLGKAAVKTLVGKGPGYSPVKLQGPRAPGIIDKGKALLSKAATKVKDVAKGAKALASKAPAALKGAVKLGGKALPFAGSALYGADAVSRAKKGDWGGAALSGLGAATSFAGPVAALAPAAIQMGTDALGLTGDRSKKGPKTVGPKLVGPKLVGPKIVGPKPSSPSGGGGGSSRPPATSTPGSSKPPASKPAPKPAPAGETDMQKWERLHPKLAAAKAERDRTRGTSSTTNPLMADMKSKLPATSASKPGPNKDKNQTPTTGPTPAIPDLKSVNADLKKANSPDALKKPAPSGSALAKEQERRKREAQQTVSSSYEYDAYDLVLEYLLSQGHADTLEEANYVMLEMDAEMIGDIVEAAADQSDEQINKGVKTTYKAGGALDNLHQGRSRGISRLPAGERSGKVKRMRDRLDARRSDLFGERNKREDKKREELKKMLGL